MTFSYTGQPSTNVIDEIRMLVQDKDMATYLVDDEEILYALEKYDNANVNATCALVSEFMAARHAKKQEVSVSNYRQNEDSVYSKLIRQADRFRAKSITSAHFKAPSISKFDKDMQEQNADRTEPFFKRGIWDNPQAVQDPFDESNLT
jgi:hypothetical protein